MVTDMRPDIASFAALATLCIVLTGCPASGDFGYVEGTVTIDGEPVEKATVGFYPQGGRGSIGATDSDGHYELRYTSSQKGASVGEHKVTIKTAVKAFDPANQPEYMIGLEDTPQEKVAARKSLLDKSYEARRTTPLTATVVPGNNPAINFDLESKKKKK